MTFRKPTAYFAILTVAMMNCANADDILLKLKQAARQAQSVADTVGKTAKQVTAQSSAGSVADPIDDSGYPVDLDMKRQEEQIAAEIKDCNNLKNVVAKMNCSSDARKRATVDRPLRGTAYAISFYATLSNNDSFNKWKELRALRDRSRSKDSFNTTRPKPAGEVTKEMLVDEMRYIVETLNQRGVMLVDEAENPNKSEFRK